MLRDLLHNQAFDERILEPIVKEYMRIHHDLVRILTSKGVGDEDILQEIRICVWRNWEKWDGRVDLQSWLSWRVKHHLLSLVRREYRRCGRTLGR